MNGDDHRPRLAPLPPAERDERQAALVAQAGDYLHADPELAVFTTLVRNPDVFADLLPFARRVLARSTLDPRLRELVVLRVAYRCRAPYVWAQHVLIGRNAGLTDADFAALSTQDTGEDPLRALMLRAADELVVDHRLGDAAWRDLVAAFSAEQAIEVCMLAGTYAMIAGTLNSLGVQPEEDNPLPA
jgi:4-carboxymuconolactone decarboxylase